VAIHLSAMSAEDCLLRLEQREDGWVLAGPESGRFGLVNEYLSHLADRNYSPKTLRSYGFDLLAFCRWLHAEKIEIAAVTTDVLLRFLAACRQARVPGRPGPNVVSMTGRRLDQYAAATVNHRLIAVSGMFAFRSMRDPDAPNPVPKGRETRRVSSGQRNGMLAHAVRRPAARSALRLREPRRLPRALDQHEAAELLASFRTWRDRAIAGLMLYCGLRTAEVLGLDVTDADIGGRWVQVTGKGNRERRVPLDPDVGAVIQAYLLAERPETASTRMFIVIAGVPAGNPHALRHTFGTALAEAGVDLAVMQALLGHAHVDTSARYIHLAPAHVKAEFDAARDRIRARS
jgi:integrase/recombinase XerD